MNLMNEMFHKDGIEILGAYSVTFLKGYLIVYKLENKYIVSSHIDRQSVGNVSPWWAYIYND